MFDNDIHPYILQYQNLLQPAVLAVKVDADVARLLDHRVGHVQEVNGPDGDDAGHVDDHDDDGDDEDHNDDDHDEYHDDGNDAGNDDDDQER